MFFLYLLSKLINYTKHPLPFPITELNKRIAVRDVLVLFILKLLIVVSWDYFILKQLFISFGVKSNMNHGLMHKYPWLHVIISCLLAPLFEEFIYRYFMKFKPLFIFIFQTFVIWSAIYFPVKHFSSLSETNLIFIKTLLFVVVAATQLIIYFKLKENNEIEEYFRKNFRIMYYVSILSFACMHIPNFNLNGHFLLVPLIILPFLISGIFYSYTRMKYGMWSNVAMHIGNNLILTLILTTSLS